MAPTRTLTLSEFLLARIAEDEERAEFVARQIEGSNWQPHEPWMLSWHDEYDLLCIEPSRALAECKSKRAIVESAAAWLRGAGYQPTKDAMEITLRRLAAVCADHPDYDESWRP